MESSTDDGGSKPLWWYYISTYPKTTALAVMATLGAIRFIQELRRDYRYRLRIRQHRLDRPLPEPETIRPPVAEVKTIWEAAREKHMNKGLGRLKHVRSRDDIAHRTYRPGSRLEEDSAAEDNENVPSRPFRILSLDGGGVKGMFTLRILERLLVTFPNLIDEVDLIAGTSTGGLVALMIANGYSPAQGMEVYRHNIPIIFQSNVWRRLGTNESF